MDRDDALDAVLAVVATGLHVAAAAAADYLPPDDVFDAVLGGLPVVAGVAAVVLLLRSDRRGLQVACTLAWLLVLFTLPAFSICVTLVPAAVVLSIAVFRPRLSSGRPAAG